MLYLLLTGLVIFFAFLFTAKVAELKKLKKILEEANTKENTSFDEEESEVLLDPLTGLVNYHAFENRLNLELNWNKRYKSQFGVMFLNIHQFSAINASGYDFGDKVLRAFSVRIKSCVRQIDTASRYGGDKFLLLLPQLAKPEMAAYVAERIQTSLLKPFDIDGRELIISANIGISIYPNDGNDSQTLIKNAHTAASQAKLEKKNGFKFFNNSIHALGDRQLALIQLLQSSEFLNHTKVEFIPYVNVISGSVFYVNAIVQLVHPIHGLVMMPELLKIAEKTKKIVDLYRWFFIKMSQQFSTWKESDFMPDKVAIDVSLAQINNPDFMTLIHNQFSELKLPSNLMVFQIHENDINADYTTLLAKFVELNKMGIEVATDILTLGHFASKQAKQIPIHYLKIDEHLTKSLLKAKELEDSSILDKMTTLANTAGITVIASGVNSEVEQSQLQQLGCYIMSGSLFNEYLPRKENV